MSLYLLWSEVPSPEPKGDEGLQTPAHCTLMQRFSTDNLQSVDQAIEAYIGNIASPGLKITEEGFLGDEGEIPVWVVERTTELVGVHENLYTIIKNLGAGFAHPEYCGENYKPHISKKNYFEAKVGDVFFGHSAVLLEFDSPSADSLRRVVRTYEYAQN